MTQQTNDFQPTILVVEDDFLLRMNAVDILEDNGFQTEEADCAASALQHLERNSSIRLLFTDIQMPGSLDGLELARLVHARWPEIRLVVTSGRVRPMRSEIPDDGRFVSKPYESKELLLQVYDLLQDQ